MSAPNSNIRVFVQWSEQTVFAGEDIECQIVFKNIATAPEFAKSAAISSRVNGLIQTDRIRKTSQLPATSPKLRQSLSTRPPPANRGHRSTLSLNIATGDTRSERGLDSWKDSHSRAGTEDRGTHRRSVSIISLGQSETTGDDAKSQASLTHGARRPSRGHNRAASLQILPRRSNLSGLGGPPSAPLAHRSTTQPSPLFHSSSAFEVPKAQGAAFDLPHREHLDLGTRKTPPLPKRNGSATFGEGFKFPAAPAPVENLSPTAGSGIREDGSVTPFIGKLLSPRPRDTIPAILEQTTPSTRVLSPVTHGETPRSSGEFYSLSNNSTETLASEYLPNQARLPLRGPHTRRISNLVPSNPNRASETLMMGYAQVAGSFTVDGSLISQAPFEEVKKKGVLGGQGGGVIGVETNKRDSGMLRGFGWGNIGESLSGFLGAGELSSIKDMRGTVSSKSIPLLSTPQSILFVDLKLAPGESRTYRYSLKLPRGLPPTHRGKAIKISYSLVIGTQRPGGAKEQQVRSVEIPFRILGSVNTHGELLGHDLMSPYIILKDQARIQSLDDSATIGGGGVQNRAQIAKATKSAQSNLEGFLEYVDELLDKPRQNSSLGLLSPVAHTETRNQSITDEPTTARAAIDMAILRSNLATDQQQSANRFEIARNGKRVAVIMLARPAYRLGETATAVIEFTDAQVPCYALHASLETSEKVDQSIALRSDASIHRVTRKVHSSHSESTLFARRVVFTPTIPLQASPSFITSSISLEWKVLIEFVTPRFHLNSDDPEGPTATLLEEISQDDRGAILAAVERLDCESFEIAVPLRIYGSSATNSEKELDVEGLIV